LYEMLTARLPFNAPTVMALLAMHMHDPPRPIHELRPDLPPPLAALVMRCLEKPQGARPASMRALIGELATVRAILGVPTPTPGYGPPPAPSPGPPSPAYGTPAHGVPPAYGTPAPGYGTPAPAYGTPAPAPGTAQPAYAAPSPAYGTPPP